ncbi:unnamed protein product, partial [Adineta steineri]
MPTANTRAQCSICNKANTTYVCSGCSNGFCFQHLTEHRQILGNKLEEIVSNHDQFQQTIIQKKQNPLNSSFIQQINQWETDSIDQIQQTAKECRETLMTLTEKSINDTENKFIELSQKLKGIREENEFNDFDLNHFQLQLTQITEELNKPSNISIRQDSQEFIKKISVISSPFSMFLSSFQFSTSASTPPVSVPKTSINTLPPTTTTPSKSIFSNASKFGAADTNTKPLLIFSMPTTTTSTTNEKPSNSSPFTFGINNQGSSFFGSGSFPSMSSTIPTAKIETNADDDREGGGDDSEYEPNVSFKLIVQRSAVEVKTGEEDENVLFCERAKLYRFDTAANQMKEQVVGEMKSLQHKTTKVCRILMRREQVLKLCANHQITSQMELKSHQGSANAYLWSAMDFADGEAKHETLCIRFKTNEQAKTFAK